MVVAGGLASALILGAVYSYGIAWIPIIYVSFLLTGGLGAVFGYIIRELGAAAKIRNPKVMGLAGFGLSFAVMYFAWAFDGIARFGADEIPVLWDIRDIIDYMKIFYEEGFWTIGRNGGTVTGLFLAAVWVVEFVVVFGLTWMISVSHDEPFCEQCNRWANRVEDPRAVVPADPNSDALEHLVGGKLDAISGFEVAATEGIGHVKVGLTDCPNCDGPAWLSLDFIQVTTNSKGEEEKSETNLVRNMEISGKELTQFQAALDVLPTAGFAAAPAVPDSGEESA